MSIQNSINFIKEASVNSEFRSTLNGLLPEDIATYLTTTGYEFTPDEFEESIYMLHVKCQFEEQANKLFEVINWYRLLTAQN